MTPGVGGAGRHPPTPQCPELPHAEYPELPQAELYLPALPCTRRSRVGAGSMGSFADDEMVIARGVMISGEKQFLFVETETENERVVSQLIAASEPPRGALQPYEQEGRPWWTHSAPRS